jgi:hypothetical protein
MSEESQRQLDAGLLVTLLEHQRTLHRQLRILSDRQRSLVAEDDAETLLRLLSERQRLVDGLVNLNARLAPYRAQWTNFYGSLDEQRRRQVALLLEEVNGSLAAILQSDGRDSATLTAKQQSMAGRLAAFDAGSRASAAYGKASTTTRAGMTDARA